MMKWFLSSFFLMFLSACFPFGKKISQNAETYLHDHPDSVYQFTGIHRSMHAVWAGDPTKRPLIFIHGSPGSWQAWAGFLNDPQLQSRFHLIAVDRAGYGGSRVGVPETSLRNQAADLEPVLNFNRSGLPAIVVGHSYGGPVAAQFALDFPNRTAGLVLVAGSVDPDQEKDKWYQFPASWIPLRWLLPDSLDVCNREILPLKGELEQLLPRWSQLKAPTIVLQGTEDDLVPPANADFLEKVLPPATQKEIVRIPRMNHFIPWAMPEAITNAILKIEQGLH